MIQWLDSNAGQPGPQQNFGIEKVIAEKGTELSGGRWLLLSYHTVLDVKTLKAYPVRPWVSHGEQQQGFNAGSIAARVFSPGRTQYVAPATADHDDANGKRPNALVVTDLSTGEAYALKLDARRMRHADFADITAGWIEHYFEWRKDPSGRELLAARAGVKPLPWQGRTVDFGDRSEYRVYRVQRQFVDVVRRLAIDKLGASVAPDWIDAARPADGMTLRCRVVITSSHCRPATNMSASFRRLQNLLRGFVVRTPSTHSGDWWIQSWRAAGTIAF